MVGNAPHSRPSLGAVKQALDGLDALAWFLDKPEERNALRAEITRLETVAESAGVARDLNEAKERARRIIQDAEATARAIGADCDRLKAQADQILSVARKEKAEAEQNAVLRKKALDARADQLDRRSAELEMVAEQNSTAAKANVSRATLLAEEDKRLKAWNARLEAAVRGP